MKRMLSVAVVLVVALVAVQVALAAGGGHGGPKGGHGFAKGKSKFQLNGTVVSADPATGAVTVLVRTGNKPVKEFRGQPLTLTIAPDARFVDAASEGDAAAALTVADLVAGARVHLGGSIDRTDPANPVFVAHKVIVQAWPDVTTPEPTPEPTVTGEPTPEPSPTEGA